MHLYSACPRFQHHPGLNEKVIAVSVCFCIMTVWVWIAPGIELGKIFPTGFATYFTARSSLGDVETLDMHYIDALISAVFVRHIDPYPAMDDDSDEPLFKNYWFHLIPIHIYIYLYLHWYTVYIHNYVYIYIPLHILYLFAWAVAFPWHQLSTRIPKWRKTAPRCWSWASNSFAHGGRGPAGPDPGSTV